MNGATPAEANPAARRSFLSPLSILVLVGLASRIFLLNWYGGEYTDGIIQLQLFENENTYFPPLYPLLASWAKPIVGDPVLAGRLVSLLALTLVLIPLFHLTRRLFNSRTAVYAGVLYLCAAVPNRWALRVMSDGLFTLFFTLGLMAFIFSLGEPDSREIPNLPKKMSRQLSLALSRARLRRWLYLLIAMAGLATLTRYQGLALLPLIAVSLYRNRKGYTRWELLETLFAVLPWAAFVYWLQVRGFGHTEQFVGRVHASAWETLLAYWDMTETFLVYFPYALTVPVFALAVAGFFSRQTSPLLKVARWMLIYLFALWLPVHAAFQSFQYRYFLPVIPLVLVFAGRGAVALEEYFRRRRWKGAESLIILILIQSLLFSVAVIYFQRNAFADLTEVGRLIGGQNLKGGRVLAAEVYNPGNSNLKLSFWAQQPIPFCEPIERFAFQPGDFVVISNVYNSMDRFYKTLSERYQFEVFYRSKDYSLVPLLPDIMVDPPGATSQPLCMAYRFHRQVYYSYVIKITGLR